MSTLDRRWLTIGLTAYVHAARTSFNCSHHGATVIAAWFLARDRGMPAEAVAAMEDQLERMRAKHSWVYAELPPSPPEPRAEERIIAALAPSIDRLRLIGHHVIFPLLAILALREVGTSVAVTDAICKLITQMDLPWGATDQLFEIDVTAMRGAARPRYANAADLARESLRPIARCRRWYAGLFQGWLGHVATHGHALIELERMGYGELARRGHAAHRLQVAQVEVLLDYHGTGQQPVPPIDDDPLEVSFWRRDLAATDWLYGHTFKNIYSVLALLELVDDADLRAGALRGLRYLKA